MTISRINSNHVEKGEMPMKDAVLLELASRWEREAHQPETEDGSEDAKISNAIAHGRRQGMRECADGLRSLIELIGD
jgi:hypothetical protein